jgi:dienelactone hydrolase
MERYTGRSRLGSQAIVIAAHRQSATASPVYQTASHAFDNPLGAVPPAEVKGGQTVRHCSIREEPEGTLINASTREPFTYKDPCVELNQHVGYDAAATEAAKKSVKQFLSELFKLVQRSDADH